MTLPRYDATACLRLAEKTEYELWLLESIYALTEQHLFRTWPDGMFYALKAAKPEFVSYMGGTIVLGDWRPGFLNAGAPLVFIVTFKLLDMFLEWVLEQNGSAQTFRFADKIRRFQSPQVFPPICEDRPWLKERLIGLFRNLEPLRGTIIHDKHFTTEDGSIHASSSKKNVLGPSVHIGPEHLRRLARAVVCLFHYVDGTWSFDDLREKTLRHDLDELAFLHGARLLGQRSPFHTCVRVYLAGTNPLQIDPITIRMDLEARYPDQDCLFDVRVVLVADSAAIDAYLFPWKVFAAANQNWRDLVRDPATFRVAIPEAIDPAHVAPVTG